MFQICSHFEVIVNFGCSVSGLTRCLNFITISIQVIYLIESEIVGNTMFLKQNIQIRNMKHNFAIASKTRKILSSFSFSFVKSLEDLIKFFPILDLLKKKKKTNKKQKIKASVTYSQPKILSFCN